MCSVEEDEDLKPLATDKSKHFKTCVKCGEPGVLITRIHDPFCKDCFQVYVVHRFRAAIGKSKLIRDGEHVLVAYSGGANSSALLNLVQDGLSVRAHKKLRFIPTLLHVDESCILELPESDKQDATKKVCHLMAYSRFTAYFSSLEQGLALNRTTKDHPAIDVNNLLRPVTHDSALPPPQPDESATSVLQARLKSVIKGLPSASSREDFIKSLRNQLMVCIAQQLGISKILTAESSTRLGVRILSDVAQGRGGQVSLNGAFADVRNKNVSFIRPLRDLNSKELTMYNYLFKVDSVSIPCLTTKELFGSSIERLTEHFVTGLQADYQSTVSNIVRTSEKLGMPDLSVTKCVLCQSPLDTQGGGASALDAVEFSLKLSQSAGGSSLTMVSGTSSCDAQDKGTTCCGQGDGTCHTKSTERILLDDMMDCLCYGCCLSLRNFSGKPESLPNFVSVETACFKQRNQLREEIAEFLIEDAE